MDDSKTVIESSEAMEHSEVTDDTPQEGDAESETNPTTVESQNLSPVGQDTSAVHQLPSDSSTHHPIETDDTPQEGAEESVRKLATLGSQISSDEQDPSVIHQLPADSKAEHHLMEADDTSQESAETSERDLATLGSQISSSVEQDVSVIHQLPAKLSTETPMEQDASVIQLPAKLSTETPMEQDASVIHKLPAELPTETPSEPSVPTSALVSLPLDIEGSDKTFSSKEPSGKRRRSVTPEIDSDGSKTEKEPTVSMSSPSEAETRPIDVQIPKVRDSVLLGEALESPASPLTHSSKKRKMEESGFSGPLSEEGAIESYLNVPPSAADIGPKSDTEEKTPFPDSAADSRSQDDNSNPDDMHQSRSVDVPSDEYGSSAEQSESGENSDVVEIPRDQSERSSDSGRKVAVLRDSSNPEERSNVQNPTSEEDEEYMEEEGIEEEEGEECEEGIEEEEGMEEEEEQSSVSSEEKQPSSNMAHAAIQESESRANVQTVATDQTISDSLARIYSANKKAKKSFTSSKSTGFQRNVPDETSTSRNISEIQNPEAPMQESGSQLQQRQDSEPISTESSVSKERPGEREFLDPSIDVYPGQPSSSKYLSFDPDESESNQIDDLFRKAEDMATQMEKPVMPKYIDNAHQILLGVFKEIMKFRNEKEWLQKFLQYYICTDKNGRPEFNYAEQLMLLVYLNCERDVWVDKLGMGVPELTLDEHMWYTFEVLTRIACTTLSLTMSTRSSYNFYAIMESYKALKIFHERFSVFQGKYDLEEIQDEYRKHLSISMSDLINTKLLLSLENAFRQLLMHIGANADQATLDEYEKELFEEDKKYLRGRFV